MTAIFPFIANATNTYNPTNSYVSVAYGPCTGGNTQELKILHKHFSSFRLYQYDQTSLDFAKTNKMQVILGSTNTLAKSFTKTGDPKYKSNIARYITKIEPYLKTDTVRVILLGNEPLNQPMFNGEQGGKILGEAITNLYTALKSKGYDIPISVNVMDDTYRGGAFDPRLNTSILPAISMETHPIFYVDLYPIFSDNNVDSYRLNAEKLLNDMYAGGNGNIGWVPAMKKKFPNIQVFIGETGWASDGGNPPNGGIVNNINEGIYLNSVHTWAVNNKYPTILFMMYDRSCKGSNWEGHFGLMKNSTTPKPNVTIP